MTIDHIITYIEKTLHGTISYELPRFPSYGVFLSPEHHWLGLLMKVGNHEYFDLKLQGEGRHLIGTPPCTAPHQMHSMDWVGIDLSADSSQIIALIKQAYAPYSHQSGMPMAMQETIIDGYHDVKLPVMKNRRISQMHAMYSTSKSEARNFVDQARTMKSYRPRRQVAAPLSAFKSLQEMNDDEIDTYYRLRSNFMKEMYHQRDLNYAKLFACELINGLINKDHMYVLDHLESLADFFKDVYFIRLVHDYKMVYNPGRVGSLQILDGDLGILYKETSDYQLYEGVLVKYGLSKKVLNNNKMLFWYLKPALAKSCIAEKEEAYTLFPGSLYLPINHPYHQTYYENNTSYQIKGRQCFITHFVLNQEKLTTCIKEIQEDIRSYHAHQMLHGALALAIDNFLSEDYVFVYPLEDRTFRMSRVFVPRVLEEALRLSKGMSRAQRFLFVGKALVDYVPHRMPELVKADFKYPFTIDYFTYAQWLTYYYLRDAFRKHHDERLFSYGYGVMYISEICNDLDLYTLEERMQEIEMIQPLIIKYRIYPTVSDHLVMNYILYHQLGEPYREKLCAYIRQTYFSGDDSLIYYIHEEDTKEDYLQRLKDHGVAHLTSVAFKGHDTLYQDLLFTCLKKLQASKAYLSYITITYRRRAPLTPLFFAQDYAKENEIVLDPLLKACYHEPDDDGFAILAREKIKASKLSAVIREIDNQARKIYHRGKPLKEGKLPTKLISMIQAVLASYKPSKETKSVIQSKTIAIDFSALEQIREDAHITTEKLLTEEERALSIEDEEDLLADEINEASFDNPTHLSKEAFTFLTMLMKGQDASDYLKTHHLMASVLAEEINESLFDEIGDNVITFEDDQPMVVEDYLEDLEDYLHT